MDHNRPQNLKNAQQIYLAQIDILYNYVPNSIITSTLAALVLVGIQWAVIAHTTLLLWLSFLLVSSFVRVFSYYKYKQKSMVKKNASSWEKYYIISAIPGFLSWGAAGLFLFPPAEPIYQSATFLTIFGMAAGGTNALASRRLPIYLFLPIVLAPITVMSFLEQHEISHLLSPLILIYAVFLFNIAKRHYINHLESITLRIESKQRENRMRITERRARINEIRLANAEHIAHLGGWEWHVATGKMYWSKETFCIFEIDTKDTLPSFELFIAQIHPDERLSIKKELLFAYKHGQKFNQTFRIQPNESTPITLKCIANPVRNKAGVVVRMTGIIQDISEQTMLEEQLLHAQKMESLGTLVGGIAHDFNNMLGNLLGQTYLAKKEVVGNTKLLGRIVNIERTSNRAAKMVQQLLVFARKDGLQLQTLDLVNFMNDTATLSEAGIAENINIQHHFSQKSIHVEGDTTQLQQVILNLLNNASHALTNQQHPEIIIRLEQIFTDAQFRQEHPKITSINLAHLSVTDNGCGISHDNIQHVFEPFYTTKEAGQGTGLGLSMVYGAIQSHHGIISVDSEEGQGTTVHIYLPIIKTDKDIFNHSSSLQNVAPFIDHGETLLLVDDDEILRESIQEALESLGYKIIAVENGAQAVEAFKKPKNKIALVVSDIVMPKMSGHEAAQHIRDMDASIPFIFMSGYDPNQLSKQNTLGNSVLLKKPTPIDKLHQQIRSFLDHDSTPE